MARGLYPRVHWYDMANDVLPIQRGVKAERGAIYLDSNKRVTRAGIRRFLSLAYDAAMVSGTPEWKHIWQRGIWVNRTCLALRLRIDGASDFDRSRVRYLLRDPADRTTQEAQRAWRWASRGGVL